MSICPRSRIRTHKSADFYRTEFWDSPISREKVRRKTCLVGRRAAGREPPDTFRCKRHNRCSFDRSAESLVSVLTQHRGELCIPFVTVLCEAGYSDESAM